MNDYARFVAARIEEDEANAGDQHRTGCGALFQYVMPCTCGVPERIRRWCTTGRDILSSYYATDDGQCSGKRTAMERVVYLMAEADIDHPDHPNHQETA